MSLREALAGSQELAPRCLNRGRQGSSSIRRGKIFCCAGSNRDRRIRVIRKSRADHLACFPARCPA